MKLMGNEREKCGLGAGIVAVKGLQAGKKQNNFF